MIFKPYLAQLIVNGRKTETRRPVKPSVPCRYEAGKDYAVQPGRGKAQVCRIEIESVRRETLGEITHQAALAEGFRNLGHFLDYWEQLYCCAWKVRDGERAWTVVRDLDLDQPVWVIEFKLWKKPPPKETQRKDRVRLLSARPAARDPYTGRAQYAAKDPNLPRDIRGGVAPEPEAIDPAEIEHIGRVSHQRWLKERIEIEAAYDELPLAQRIAKLQQLAKEHSVDISGPLKQIERETKRALRRIPRAA